MLLAWLYYRIKDVYTHKPIKLLIKCIEYYTLLINYIYYPID